MNIIVSKVAVKSLVREVNIENKIKDEDKCNRAAQNCGRKTGHRLHDLQTHNIVIINYCI